MSFLDWVRPPRRLIALFVLLTLGPSALIVALGWRLYGQDQQIESTQARARRDQAADTIVAALDQRTLQIERTLGDPAAAPADEDTVVVTLNHDAMTPVSSSRLLYYPTVSTLHGSERAAAAIAEGRTHARLGRPDRALASFRQAATLEAATLGGVPTSLLARWALCGLLAEQGRGGELRTEAAALRADLLRGRWALTRPAFEANLADADAWLGTSTSPDSLASRVALATAAAALWDRRAELLTVPASGRSSSVIDGRHVTLLWRRDRSDVTALLAGPDGTSRLWLGPLASAAERQQVRVALLEPASRGAGSSIRRSAADTGLPWTVAVEDTGGDAADTSRARQRRTIWLAGLAVVGLSLIAGTLLTSRAVARELAVARLQSHFVSTVSHEFRTPLTSLRQLSEMLLQREDLPEERRREYYAALSRQTERLHRLVEGLLDFGRMQAGTSPYRFSRLSLVDFIRGVAAEFEADAAAREHRVQVTMPDANPSIDADPEALRTALWNLLDNAVKYSPGCPTIWMDLETVDDAVHIRVRDRGLGIPRQELPAIFGKFFRGAQARSENIKGTGIGLAMVQHVVAAHGGSVKVESEPGAGSTFTVCLPT